MQNLVLQRFFSQLDQNAFLKKFILFLESYETYAKKKSSKTEQKEM